MTDPRRARVSQEEPTKYCEHATCREKASNELAYMGAVLQRQDLTDLAPQAYRSTVRCRHQPRRGPVKAPFPTRRDR